MTKLTAIAFFALLATGAQALTQQEIEAAAREAQRLTGQEQQRIDAQQERLEGDKKPSGLDLTPQSPALERLQDADGKCIELNRITIKDSQLIDEWELEVLEAPFLGKCITPDLASQVLASTTNFYLTRGFITSRAYLPNQNLKQGELQVQIAEGQVAEVVVKSKQALNVETAYEKDVDLGLNIRDLEQAVDQMNAVPGNQVVMTIQPGEQAQSSNVVFENKGKPVVRGSFSVDNTGSASTGAQGASVSVQTGDLLSLNDVWSLSARRSLGEPEKSSRSLNLDVRVPQGLNTYGVGYSRGGFDTLLNFPQSGAQLTSEGANESLALSATRVIHRDQASKHTLGVKLKRDSVESYIADTKIDVNSRTLDSLALTGESVLAFGKNVLVVGPEIAVGLSEVDSLPVGVNTPVENPQSEYLRYKLSLDWSQPLTLGGQALRWKSRWVGQYANVPLYGSQQLIVGGAASVRGSHTASIVGDRGYVWQNTVSMPAQHTLGDYTVQAEYSLGYDRGHVWSERPDVYEGGMRAWIWGANFSTGGPVRLSLLRAMPLSVDGDVDKGDAHTSVVLSLDF